MSVVRLEREDIAGHEVANYADAEFTDGVLSGFSGGGRGTNLGEKRGHIVLAHANAVVRYGQLKVFAVEENTDIRRKSGLGLLASVYRVDGVKDHLSKGGTGIGVEAVAGEKLENALLIEREDRGPGCLGHWKRISRRSSGVWHGGGSPERPLQSRRRGSSRTSASAPRRRGVLRSFGSAGSTNRST